MWHSVFLKRGVMGPEASEGLWLPGGPANPELSGPEPPCPQPLPVQLALVDEIGAWGGPLRVGPELTWAEGCPPGSL